MILKYLNKFITNFFKKIIIKFKYLSKIVTFLAISKKI